MKPNKKIKAYEYFKKKHPDAKKYWDKKKAEFIEAIEEHKEHEVKMPAYVSDKSRYPLGEFKIMEEKEKLILTLKQRACKG